MLQPQLGDKSKIRIQFFGIEFWHLRKKQFLKKENEIYGDLCISSEGIL
jgi:hypothetical protein